MNGKEWNPGELLKVSGGYWTTCTLHAGVLLDVFTTIGNDQLMAEKIAEKLDADTRGVTMLVNALSAMCLLKKRDNTYRNTEASLRFLSKTSPRYLGHIILHHHHLMESWARLSQGVKTGKPIRTRSSYSDQQWRESFLMGMFDIAMQIAPEVVSKIDLSHRRHLLDLGGGPGTFAIHFCKQNPRLKATVYDLPTTRPFAEKTIERFGLTERITFTDMDFLKDGIKETYDVAWLSHILHGESPENCRRIIESAASALESGGMIFIHDFVLNNTMDGPLFPALFSLNMLLGTDGGQAYSEQQIEKMLSRAGVKKIHRIPIETPNDSGIIGGMV